MKPLNLADHPTIRNVGRVLNTLVSEGTALQKTVPEWVTPFHSDRAPAVGIDWYFGYVALNSGLQDEQAVAVLILIERLCKSMADRGAPILVSQYTAHR